MMREKTVMAPHAQRVLFVLTVIGVAIAGAAYFFRPLPPPQAQ